MARDSREEPPSAATTSAGPVGARCPVPFRRAGTRGHPGDPPGLLVEHRSCDVDAFEQPGTGLARRAGQCLVEAAPAAHHPVARVTGQVGPVQFEADPAADDAQALVREPAVLGVQRDPHADELLDRARGQPVAAHLFPGEMALLQHQHVQPGLRQVESGRRARRPGAYHNDVSRIRGGGGRGAGRAMRAGASERVRMSCEAVHKCLPEESKPLPMAPWIPALVPRAIRGRCPPGGTPHGYSGRSAACTVTTPSVRFRQRIADHPAAPIRLASSGARGHSLIDSARYS